jgi:hypothetical protein
MIEVGTTISFAASANSERSFIMVSLLVGSWGFHPTPTSCWCAHALLFSSLPQVKPDGVHRGLVGDVIKRFEQRGYKLVGIKVRLAGSD